MKNGMIQTLIIALIPLLISDCKRSNEIKPIRILYGGIAHESNTFNPYLTETEDFILTREKEGEELIQSIREEIGENNLEVIFTLVARSGPYGVVAREAYESFRDEILEGARNAGRLDGVMLQMHGALHVEGYPDAQVDFIKRLREIVGEEVIISGSFDLHGNMSEEFVNELNILTAYRTAPHVDGFETICRGTRLLVNAIKNGHNPEIAHLNIPILIPGEKGITGVEPLKSMYEQLPEISQKEGIMDASIFVGMPWTDVKRAGMSVQVVAEDPEYMSLAWENAKRLAKSIWEERANLKFDVSTNTIDGAILTAQEAPESTVFITDSGDNTTAGAAGDGTLALRKLLEYKVKDAVMAGIYDPDAVAACEEVGVNGKIDMLVGGKLDTVFSEPLRITGTVEYISDTTAREKADKRPAVIRMNGIHLVVLNQRRSFTSPTDFEEAGINPLNHKIVIVKLGYLFQELRDIAPRTIMALTPGFANQKIEDLPYRNVRHPIYPLDPEMEWNP